MPEIQQLIILFVVSLLAGIINTMAGGGSALTLPVLLFLGLDAATANGTNRIAIVAQSLFAVLSFRHARVSRVRQSLVLGACTLPGVVLGVVAAVRVSDVWFERILGVIMIGVVITMLLPRGGGKITTAEGTGSWWAYPAMVGIGFYGGFIQVGVGFLIMAALYHLLKMDLVFVNMHKAFVVLLYTIPALILFAWSGNVDWPLGISLMVGNALGGWFAAKVTVRGGEKVVRYVMILAILIMAMKILGVF